MSNNNSLEYANARIKTLEKNLLTSDKIIRLLDAHTISEAMKILLENNYGDEIIVDGDFDKLLFKEEEKTLRLFKELMPTGYGLETFVYENDFHNAKVYSKSKLTGKPNDLALKPVGLYDVKGAFEKENYANLPNVLQEALKTIDDERANGTLNGRKIDNIIDKAYYSSCVIDTAKARKSVVQDYYKILIDSLNIKTFVRCKLQNLPLTYYTDAFVEGGELSKDRLTKFYPLSLDEISEKMKYTDWKDDFSEYDLSKFETKLDNKLIKLIKAQKADMFTPAPILGYYLGKLSEIKVVRTLLTCKKNGVAPEEIRKRIRETYA